MSDRDRMQELIDLYCDADRRGRIESPRDTSPTIAEVSEQTMYLRERIQAERYKTVMGIIQCIAITIIGTLFIGMGW